MTLTGVSLFAGVGGFDLAMQRNGIDVKAAVEIDDAARGVLAHRFPDVQLFTDVCEVTGDQLRAAGFIPERGVLTGGFPCQDLSTAGKRAGLSGARSGLFWEICRLLDETKAQWFVLENVPGLLSSNQGRDMGTVVGALAELGYGIAYRILDAQYFGVPQRRRRVVIVGHLGDNGHSPAQVLALTESSSWRTEPRNTTRKAVTRNVGDSVESDSTSGVSNSLSLPPTSVWPVRAQQHHVNYSVTRPQVSDGLGSDDMTWLPIRNVVGALSIGAHPGGFNGQDAYTGQVAIRARIC